MVVQEVVIEWLGCRKVETLSKTMKIAWSIQHQYIALDDLPRDSVQSYVHCAGALHASLTTSGRGHQLPFTQWLPQCGAET
jgi:hypothetical protein